MSSWLWWLVLVVVGVVAYRRLRDGLQETRDELHDARADLSRLRGLVENLRKAVPVEAPGPVVEPPLSGAPASEEPTSEEAVSEPPASTPAPSERVPEEPPPPRSRPASAPATSGATIGPGRSASPSRRPSIEIDWERWVGVRGAAVLGGAVLALAAILFLKYSIERGLIPPVVRVALGFLAGGGSIFGSEILRRRRYGATADAVAGAGVVILYAAVWAARALYALIPAPLAWALMVLVTVVCGLLAWRRESLVIALLGLAGGFTTPLLLGTTEGNPIGLFGYVLLLDVGLLWLASRRRWPLLALLSLGATFFYQGLWIFLDMPPARFGLTLGILGLFALLFAWAGPRRGEGEPAAADRPLLRAAGVLLPFLYALHFAARADLGLHLAPVAALAALLSLAASWIGRRQGVAWLPLAAAAADVGVVATWVGRTRLSPALCWELAAVAVALVLALHWPLELDRREKRKARTWAPAVVAAVGLAVLVVFARLDPDAATIFWPWLVGWLALTGLCLRQAAIASLPRLRLAAAALPALAFTRFVAAHGDDAAMPAAGLFLALLVILAAAFQLYGLIGRRGEGVDADSPDAAAALAALAASLALVLTVGYPGFTVAPYFAATILLALLALLAATRLGAGSVYLASAAALAVGHTLWVYDRLGAAESGAIPIALAGCAAGVVLYTGWPFLAGGRLAADRVTLYTAALAAPAWFPALRRVYERAFGDGAIAILPLALGALALAAAMRGRRYWPASDPAHKRSLVWFLSVALGFVALAIPLQLEKEWITVGWALQGLAVMALWQRLDHPGLRYFGLALLGAVTVRLVANPALLGYYPPSAMPVVNWLMYTYLVPAAALLWTARIQERAEVARRPPWERGLYSGPRPLGAAACGVAAILVVFVWINLTILDAFSSGSTLSLSLERLPARDLTLSLAWTLYAVLLLAVGMARRSVALRWISLAFLILAIGKVFLYDLGELRDLYRVASLVGLAGSLLVVSLAYQRFVFGDRREPAATTGRARSEGESQEEEE